MRRVAPFLLLAFVLAGCGGKQIVSPTAETVVGTVAAEKQQAAGDAKAGATLFTAQGCGGCHALADAGTTGGTGPDLDEGLAGKDEAFIEESIVDPSAEITEGFQDGIMPPSYGQSLTPAELDSLVKYLAEVTN